MTHEVMTQWMGKMQFNALVNGHTVVMDAPERSGGEDLGPIPKPFVLTALSGCTGMDVIALLRKKGIVPDSFDINVSGEISKQAPIQYVAMHIVYDLKGNPEHAKDALEAVDQSQEKYCGVSAMLKKALPVTWEVIYNGEMIFNNNKTEKTAAA